MGATNAMAKNVVKRKRLGKQEGRRRRAGNGPSLDLKARAKSAKVKAKVKGKVKAGARVKAKAKASLGLAAKAGPRARGKNGPKLQSGNVVRCCCSLEHSWILILFTICFNERTVCVKFKILL